MLSMNKGYVRNVLILGDLLVTLCEIKELCRGANIDVHPPFNY